MKTKKPLITSNEFKEFSTKLCKLYPDMGSTFTPQEIYDEYFVR